MRRLVRAGLLCRRLQVDHTAQDRTRPVQQRTSEEQIALRVGSMMVLPCLIIQMLAAIGEDQAIEVCHTAWFTEQHALCCPVQPTPQRCYSPAQLTVGGKHGTLMAHPPQAAAPVLHLE